MLTRLRFRKDFRVIARFLSDKPADGDNKHTEVKQEKPKKDAGSQEAESSTDKIQHLLKQMMIEGNNKENENRAKFATAPDSTPRTRYKKKDVHVETVKIEEKITKAAGDVAQALGGDVKHTEAELLSKVLGKINQSTSLSDLISGMKVDRSKDGEDKQETRGQQVKRMVTNTRTENKTRFAQRKDRQMTERQDTRPQSSNQVTTIDIFNGQSLGIFTKKEPDYGTKLETWEELKQRELSLATAQPPTNYFQKMIQWTQQGKVWQFPINNEQGLEEELDVHFSEHIFLDAHLEDWCPKKGPIRHFMELVCVGLSKNAFYTVQEKIDHIMWYKEYFESKKDLLTEVGVWDNFTPSKEASV